MIGTTPMFKQYHAIKADHKDAILFLEWAIFMRCSVMMQKRPVTP